MTTEAIKLQYPIDVDGVQIDTLHMRRPRVSDIKTTSKVEDPTESSIKLMSILCSMPPEAVENLDLEDFASLSKKVEGFLESGTQKSEKS